MTDICNEMNAIEVERWGRKKGFTVPRQVERRWGWRWRAPPPQLQVLRPEQLRTPASYS